MGDPVVVQPGYENKQYAAQQPIAMQPYGGGGMPQGAGNIPPGLEYLAQLDRINVNQILHLLEVMTGFEKQNQYRICNTNDQQFLHAKEQSECCERQFCGNIRSFQMTISNMHGQPTMVLDRPFNCQGCCCPCCLQELEIQVPPGNPVAKIKEIWTCLTPKYEIVDMTDNVLFRVEGPVCYCKCGCDVEFGVTRADGSQVGSITKQWGGCREICGQVNDFFLTFPINEPVTTKAILLGATFLIDFMYFEVKNN